MEKLKTIGYMAGVMLFVLSLAACYVGWMNYSDIRDAEEYEDAGVFSFAPYQVLPEQVENYGRNRRLNPTDTVYMVYYRATDGSSYRWKEEATSKSTGEDMVAAGAEVERRVLRIPANGSYITVEPEQSAKSYTQGLRQKYILMMVASVIYIVGYSMVYIVQQKRRGECESNAAG